MRLGIMGGTFDPPHLGHLVPVETAATEFSLDQVWFIPNYIPPHKSRFELTDAYHRAAMLAIALQRYRNFLVSTVELQKQKPNYTVDTVSEVLDTIASTDRLFFIMGSDSFVELQSWRDYPRLLQLCELIIINRGNTDRELKESLEKLEIATRAKLEQRVHFAKTSFLPISSTEVRDALAEGRSVSSFLFPEVEAYIAKHSLYQRRKQTSV